MPAREQTFYGAFKVTRFLIGKLKQFFLKANLRRGVIDKLKPGVDVNSRIFKNSLRFKYNMISSGKQIPLKKRGNAQKPHEYDN